MINKAVAEFFSRLLIWFRVFSPGFFLLNVEYGLVIKYVTYEVLVGGISSYFCIKHMMIHHSRNSELILFIQSSVLCLLLCSIIFLLDDVFFVNLFFSSLFFTFSQIALYSIRLKTTRYAAFRLCSSVLSTAVFYLLLLINVEYFSEYYYFVSLSSFLCALYFMNEQLTYRVNVVDVLNFIRYNFKDILNFTFISISTNSWTYGIRLLIVFYLGQEALGQFSKPLMLASAITFLYAITMIIFEPKILASKSSDNAVVKKVAFFNFIVGCFYFFSIHLISLVPLNFISEVKSDYINVLFYVIFLSVFIHGIYLPINSKLISFGNSNMNLISVLIAALSMFTYISCVGKSISLLDFSISYLISEVVLVLTTFLLLIRSFGKMKDER